jgi:hypothetical protein
VKQLLALLACAFFVVGCCTSNVCRATVAANLMHDAGEGSAEALRVGCTERYHAAQSTSEIAELDKPCLPAAAAYGAFQRAHAALVAVLVAIEAGDTGAAVGAALKAAQEAAIELAQRIAEVPR